MKKVILFTGLLLIGAACSKSEDNNNSNDIGKGGNGDKTDKIIPVEEVIKLPKRSFEGEVSIESGTYTADDYTFDDKGRLTTIEHNGYVGGQKNRTETTTEYTYNGDTKQVIEVRKIHPTDTITYALSYNDKGNITVVRRGNIVIATYEYDTQGKLKALKNQQAPYQVNYPTANTVELIQRADDGSIQKKIYTLDENGDVVKKVEESYGTVRGELQLTSSDTFEYTLSDVKNPFGGNNKYYAEFVYDPNAYDETYNKFLTQKQVRTIYNKISDSRSEETTTYQYEKNAEGYPTKITEKFNDTEARVVVKYQY
ncbi:hypothetical protein HMPREF1551_01633 [Capnocytophaga sp. oral taxon 863 str. F0517]|jgi:hypothetical protein|uniref:DUF4595 domain-containing protein n=1 Tax=Capnocytophaga sp. oral taxon 863 TaxID=1227265 RepID=UPI0003972FE3|nr:DUF4595 domain-containing protein [Capnocytophaga sp. oral taxon 863]ERI62833.1 hypothetical protein HMPREF1551_01633 [Capnocytophaga sp. oral taxon 863 str. F0517]